MGFYVGSLSSANTQRSIIDPQALANVKEQILNPNNDKTIDVSKLDLTKFNRVNIGTDLYAQKTDGEVALRAAKAASDFGIQFSDKFNVNIQYLNSQAAQGLFTSKENNGKVVLNTDNIQTLTGNEAVTASEHVVEAQNMKQDKRGQNPFAFYVNPFENSDEDDGNKMQSELDELSRSIFVPKVNILA